MCLVPLGQQHAQRSLGEICVLFRFLRCHQQRNFRQARAGAEAGAGARHCRFVSVLSQLGGPLPERIKRWKAVGGGAEIGSSSTQLK